MEGGRMTQETVERILGRILTDARFRRRFFSQRLEHLREFDLVDHERESLSNLDPDEVELLLELLAERLDPRIVRG